MIFRNVEFPRRIAMGAQYTPSWLTDIAQVAAGFENANQRWSAAKHDCDVSFAVRNNTDYALIVVHFHQVRGRTYSFPLKHALDYRCEQAQGVLIETSDSPSTWRLHKRYGSGAYAYDRLITRPMPTPAPAVYRTRSAVVTAVTGSSTIDYTNGDVSISGHVAGDTYAWSGQFFVPSRYDTDKLPSVVVNRQPGANGELLVSCDSIPICEVREL